MPLSPQIKKALLIGGGMILLWTVTAGILFVPPAGWISADVTTGQHTGYPDLTPRVYNMSPANTMIFATTAIKRQSGWQVVRATPDGILDATTSGFPSSNLTVTITPDGPEGRNARVVIHSRSSFGFADLGANARHIRALQATMDDKLPRLDISP